MQVQTVTGGGGIRLHIEETGNPGGRPILFIHGFSQCRLAWRKQLKSQLAEDFRLVALDIRGHGLSEKPADAYGDSHLWADDVEAVIDALELERPVLCGWSYGGAVIFDYVRYYGEERLGGINLVGAVSKLGRPAVPLSGADFLAMMSGLFSDDAEKSVGALEALARLWTYAPLSPADFYFFLGCSVIVPPYVRRELFSRTVTNDDLLPTLRKPVLISHGRADQVVLFAAAQEHAAAIDHAQTSFYDNTGHLPFWEAAGRFNDELRAFVAAT